MPSAEKERLLELAKIHLVKGVHTFSGGRKSDYYFDGRMITLSAEGCFLVGRLVESEISGLEIDAIGGPALGAIPIVTATQIIRGLSGKPLNGFFVRGEIKEHGTQKLVEGYLPWKREVVIVEDTVSTASSVFPAIQVAEYQECTVLMVIALLDWQLGGGARIQKAGYDFRPFLLGDISTGELSIRTS